MSRPERILITGCAGFVGSYLAERCRKRYPDAELFGLYNRRAPQQLSLGLEGVEWLQADILRVDHVRKVVADTRPDVIFHLAAQSSVAVSWSDPVYTLQVNACGTLHLLEAARRECPAARVVLVGSAEQYGAVKPHENPIREEQELMPTNPYAISKVAQDRYGQQYFAAYGLPVIRVRSFNHFGPRQADAFVLASFARQIAQIEAGKSEPVVRAGNLQIRRDFLPIEDAIAAYLAVGERGQPGEAYNVGSGQAHSIGMILALLLSFAHRPIRVCQDAALMRPMDIPVLEADISRIQAHTGWRPMKPFEVALEELLDYWRGVVQSM